MTLGVKVANIILLIVYLAKNIFLEFRVQIILIYVLAKLVILKIIIKIAFHAIQHAIRAKRKLLLIVFNATTGPELRINRYNANVLII